MESFAGGWGRRTTHYLQRHPLLPIFMVVVGLISLWLLFPTPVARQVLAPDDEGSRVYFGDARVLGQEFSPAFLLREIRIPLGAVEGAGGPLLLHLREDLQGQDVRVSAVFAVEGSEAVFRFQPLLRPPVRMMWVLEAPHSKSRTYWAYREHDMSTFDEGRAFIGARPTSGHYGFTTIQYMPQVLQILSRQSSTDAWSFNVFTFWEWQSIAFGVACALIALFVWPRFFSRIRISDTALVLTMISISFIAHGFFAWRMPLVNDEGAYIQDVVQAKIDFWPFRDYLTKGPGYLLLLKLWSIVAPNTVLGWRLFSALAWAVGAWGVWLLTASFALPRRQRLLSVALFTLLPATVSLTTPLLLQTVSVPVLVWALWATVTGARGGARSWIAASAALVCLAFFIRVSSVVGGFLSLLVIAAYSRHKLRDVVVYSGTCALILIAAALLAASFLGWQKAAVMFNAEAFLISQQRQQAADERVERDPLVRQLTIEARVLWRGAPLLLLGLFLFPVTLIRRRRLLSASVATAFLLLVMQLVYFHLRDTDYLLPGRFAVVQFVIMSLVFGAPLLFLLFRLVTVPNEGVVNVAARRYVWVLVVWLVVLVFLYASWGRFRQSYLVEFLVPLALLTAWTLVYVWRFWQFVSPVWLRQLLLGGLWILIGMSFYQSAAIAWRYPHTGTIDQGSLRQFVRLLQQVVPEHEAIFTAQPVVTALARRPIIFGNSHPGWYREARFGTISEELRDLLFVRPEAVTRYLRDEARYVVMERRTSEIYMDGYPERQQILRDSFELVGSVANPSGGDDLQLYRRQ